MSMLLLSLLLLLFKMSQVFGNCSKRTCSELSAMSNYSRLLQAFHRFVSKKNSRTFHFLRAKVYELQLLVIVWALNSRKCDVSNGRMFY